MLEPEEVLFNLLLWAVLCVCSAAFPTAEESMTQGRCSLWHGNLLRCETEQIFRFIFQAWLFLTQRRGNHLCTRQTASGQASPVLYSSPQQTAPTCFLLPSHGSLNYMFLPLKLFFWLRKTREPLP